MKFRENIIIEKIATYICKFGVWLHPHPKDSYYSAQEGLIAINYRCLNCSALTITIWEPENVRGDVECENCGGVAVAEEPEILEVLGR